MPAPRPDWAYFFDIDGTLVDIAESPERVHVDLALRRLIETLHRSAAGAVALISGRAIADIDALFPARNLPVAGQHGAERRDAAGTVSRPSHPPARFYEVRSELSAIVKRHPALRLEDKGLSLALHYRQAPQLGGYVHRVMRALQARSGGRLRFQSGKRVAELVPAASNKGSAVLEFMEEPPFRGRVLVFIGDDVTDEAAFAIVNRLGGHSVKVGAGPTAARWQIADVATVRGWLEGGAETPYPRHRRTAGGRP